MTAPLPIQDDVAGMRERHVRQEVRCGQHGCDAHCAWCTDPWPCDAARLLALVDETRGAVVPFIEEAALIRGRLAAVLAECDLLDEQTSGYVDVTPIRRAATGEAS